MITVDLDKKKATSGKLSIPIELLDEENQNMVVNQLFELMTEWANKYICKEHHDASMILYSIDECYQKIWAEIDFSNKDMTKEYYDFYC